MKKVFGSHSEVAHIWAQQNQPEGRAGNIYFDGAIIYSYGAHYKMAMIHGRSAGELVLINSSGYSSSTGKHTAHVRSAVSHLETVDVPLVDPNGSADHKTNLEYIKGEIDNAQRLAIRARTRGAMYIREAEALAGEYNKYSEFCGSIIKIDAGALFTDDARAKISETMKADEARRREAKKQRLALLSIELDKWQAGGSSQFRLTDAPIRLRVAGDNIETSHGALVPIEDTLFLLEGINNGADINGFKIGYYTADYFNETTLKIGCHYIPMVEVRKIERLLARVHV